MLGTHELSAQVFHRVARRQDLHDHDRVRHLQHMAREGLAAIYERIGLVAAVGVDADCGAVMGALYQLTAPPTTASPDSAAYGAIP
jgi:hypothetical protein